ncbi:Putative Translation factor pelota [Rhizopus microsporus]|nr:Putative Translation factor pelota [Rhizopus microsporus]
MWHVYNLISKGDMIKATTIRRLQSESSTGSSTSQRIRLTLTITVENVDFDPIVGLLRINGRVSSENTFVKMGSYHTIDLELNRNFTLFKPEWDTIALERVDDACDVAKQADVAAVVCQEGLANLCFLTQHMTVVRQRIETPIPRKRKGSVANHEKGLEKFYEQIYQAILRHVHFDIVKAIIIASPGFVKDQVYNYIFDQAVKTGNKTVLESKSKFILIHCSNGHKHALTEIMQDPTLQVKLADTKAAREVQALDKFYEMMNMDPDRAFYGFDHVSKANERGAVGTLLVTDELFRSADIDTRKKYVALVEQVRAQNGNVYVFSSMHASGEQLNQLTGVAAILNFPVPDIDEEDE